MGSAIANRPSGSQHCAKRSSRSPLRLLVCLLWLGFALHLGVLAQTTAPAFRPPKAQDALNKGVIAAREQDYLLAIRYFQDARTIAPSDPLIFLNLGLAESRIPGRELRAMAWFGAYLAANPNASNAATVKDQIDALDVRSQSNNSHLIKVVQDAASQPPFSDDGSFLAVVDLWANFGDFAAALKTADLIQDAENKSSAQQVIAEAQAKAGDIAGALKTTDLLLYADQKGLAQAAIAKAQAKAGDFAGARTTSASALKNADLILDPYFKAWTQAAIAEGQVKAGDTVGARITSISALKNAGLVVDEDFKSVAQARIAEVQASAGDIEGAQNTAELIPDAGDKNRARVAIAEVQTGARVTKQTSVQLVSYWLRMLDNDNDNEEYGNTDTPLNTPLFLDLAGHLTAGPSADRKELPLYLHFDWLKVIAQRVVTARNVIDEKLKQQAGK
jgi:tetratricopeptide (TPR) repeat protein